MSISRTTSFARSEVRQVAPKLIELGETAGRIANEVLGESKS